MTRLACLTLSTSNYLRFCVKYSNTLQKFASGGCSEGAISLINTVTERRTRDCKVRCYTGETAQAA